MTTISHGFFGGKIVFLPFVTTFSNHKYILCTHYTLCISHVPISHFKPVSSYVKQMIFISIFFFFCFSELTTNVFWFKIWFWLALIFVVFVCCAVILLCLNFIHTMMHGFHNKRSHNVCTLVCAVCRSMPWILKPDFRHLRVHIICEMQSIETITFCQTIQSGKKLISKNPYQCRVT